jgi:hypothetical protein
MGPLKLHDRVRETAVTTGTGTLTLAGAVSGYRAFSTAGDGALVPYDVVHRTAAEWETGLGTYTAAGTLLSRDFVSASSNGGNKVSFSAGTKDVFLNLPAPLLDRQVYPARAFGLVGDGVTDDTAALQALLNLVVAAGGGVIDLEAKTYLFGGALQDTGNSNSQLTLPAVALTSPTVSITLRGPLAPPKQFFTWSVMPSGCTVLKSTLAGASGTAAMIAGPLSSVTSPNQNNVALNLENLIIQVPANPTFTAVNLKGHQGCEHRNVLVVAGTAPDLDGLAQPTHANSYAVKLPETNHSARTRVDGLTVFGFYNGLLQGELADVDANFWGCVQAVVLPFCYHPSRFGLLGIYWCTHGIVAAGVGFTGVGGDDGTHYTTVELLDIEHANNHGAAWQNAAEDVLDAANLVRGDVKWIAIASAVGNDHTFTKTGGANFNASEIGAAGGGTAAPQFSSAEVGNVDASTVVVTFDQNVKAGDYKAGVVIKVNGVAATISSAARQATRGIVRYALSSAVTAGQTVTWEYAAIDGFIGNAADAQLADVSAQAVTNNVGGGGSNVLDQFTDANGTALAAHAIGPTNDPATAWAVDEGSFAIQGNKARASTSTAVNSASCNPGVADCTLTCTVRFASGTIDLGVKFRGIDLDNYWLADLRKTDGTFKIFEKTGGTYTERASVAKVPAANTDYVIQVVLSGNSMVATVDGGSSINFTSAVRNTAVRHGIWASLGSAADNADFNDFTVAP